MALVTGLILRTIELYFAADLIFFNFPTLLSETRPPTQTGEIVMDVCGVWASLVGRSWLWPVDSQDIEDINWTWNGLAGLNTTSDLGKHQKLIRGTGSAT